MDEPQARPAGIEGVELPGPFPVGAYAARLKDFLQDVERVQVFGELFNLRLSRARAYFELRDGDGAIPCAIWRNRLEAIGLTGEELADGVQLVLAGGPDYYPGSRTASPGFSFDVTAMKVAGEGDLLAQLERLRRQLDSEGLFEPQRLLPRSRLPRTIGVVTGETGKARDDILAGLRRRGWEGRLVWAFAPVQDRHAAPRITEALQELAAIEEVETVIVARGGGSLADLFAFCDETLCRTVAMLRVPVISSVGHHTDRTLIDDVAAVACSTPTHAAEVAVEVVVPQEWAALRSAACDLERRSRLAVAARARALASLARVPGEQLQRHRRDLHQRSREIRAASARVGAAERDLTRVRGEVLRRKAAAAAGPETDARRRALAAVTAALEGADPKTVLARGYAIVEAPSGEPVTSAAEARRQEKVRLRFADGEVGAKIEDDG
ncbi:MAG: exodeoxyribonuclease VII large subunit [Solirubrobacterales bacterium]